MKYLILIYANPKNWSHPVFLQPPEPVTQDELDAMSRANEAMLTEIRASGELLGGQPLAAPATSKTVRMRQGVTTVTDGPYAETKEQLAGYVVVECDTIERAVEIASRYPDIRFGALEVRPIMEFRGQDI